MIKQPEVFGLIACTRLEIDPQTGGASLVGVFQSLHFPVFPTPAQSFTLFAVLYDGSGEGTIQLVINRLETEQDILYYRRWYTCVGRGRIANLEIQLRKCVFPATGRYEITLRFDMQDLAHRYLDIRAE